MRKKLLTVSVASLVFSLTPATPSAEQELKEPLDIGSRLELFVDDYLIESLESVRLKLHEPRSAGKALTLDKPWEGNTCAYFNLLQDGDLYRMYYRGSNLAEYALAELLQEDEKVLEDHPAVIAYAESRDGIRWEKPTLGLFEFNGSKDNNIVWMDKPGDQRVSDCMYVFKDGNPAVPDSQRYKAVGGSSYPLIGLVSSDGLRWTELQGQKSLIEEGLHRNAFDALNVVFWDSFRKKYVIFFRDSDRGPHPKASGPAYRHQGSPVLNYGNRSFKFASSDDFINWSSPQWVDFGDAPAEHLYTNSATAYFRAPHIYLAFPKRFVPWRSISPRALAPGASEMVFLSSRDGLRWDRRFMEAFVRPGRGKRNWMPRTNMAAVGLVQTTPDTISLYLTRHYTSPSLHLERMTLRTDGFVSVHAGYEGGELLTKPLIFEGEKLVLNFATSAAGSIRVEIQDASGNPLPGFALDASPLIFGDDVEQTVQWDRTHSRKTSEEMLRRVSGTPVRLRFVMKDADLYSLRFR